MKQIKTSTWSKRPHSQTDNGTCGLSIKDIFDDVCEQSHIDSQVAQSPLTINNVLIEINALHNKYPSKPLCLVSSWCVWQVVSDCNNTKEVISRYIVASFVIKDEVGEIGFGRAIKSSKIITEHSEYILETSDRVFVLIGNGLKKTGIF